MHLGIKAILPLLAAVLLLPGCGGAGITPAQTGGETMTQQTIHPTASAADVSNVVVEVTTEETQLTPGLSAVGFEGEYGLDAFLEQGGAASDREVVAFLGNYLGGAVPSIQTKGFGCSALSVPSPEPPTPAEAQTPTTAPAPIETQAPAETQAPVEPQPSKESEAPVEEPVEDPAPAASAATLTVRFGDGGDPFTLYMKDNVTADDIVRHVGTAAWRLPIYHYDDYDDYDGWEPFQYYDIPSRYKITPGTGSITSAKAGEVYYSEPNRIILFYHDAEISGDYTYVGTFDATDEFVEAVENNPVLEGWGNQIVNISID